jgi:hypothetical protein
MLQGAKMSEGVEISMLVMPVVTLPCPSSTPMFMPAVPSGCRKIS